MDIWKPADKTHNSLEPQCSEEDSVQSSVSVYVFCVLGCVGWAGGLLLLLVGCGAVLWDICGLRDGLCGTVLC